MARRKVWLDCDPGHDDAMAILLAAHSPGSPGSGGIELVGVSTVSGNQSIEKTTANAVRVLEAIGADPRIKVVQGQARPLIKEIRHDPGIHGESGLEGSPRLDAVPVNPSRLVNPGGSAPPALPGVVRMAAEIVRATAGGDTITVVATGALTNVALMLALHPEVRPRIAEVVLMGGAIGMGNRHPVAEFNILCDPEAAKMVFDDPLVKVVMVPLEVTHTALATPAVLNRLAKSGTPLAAIVVQLLAFFKDTYERTFGFNDGPPVHDPCAVAYVLRPDIFETALMNVEVICGEHSCAGQTVCDVWGDRKDRQQNVHVCTKMEVPVFWDMMLASLRVAERISPLGNAARASKL